MADGEHSSLAAGRGAGVQDARTCAQGGDFPNKLRSLGLNPRVRKLGRPAYRNGTDVAQKRAWLQRTRTGFQAAPSLGSGRL